jgi:hypothetical protein
MVIKSDPEAREAFVSLLFRSAYYALTGYFLTLLLERLIMFIAAASFGYSVHLDYEYLKIKGNPESWNQDIVLIIYLFPYLIFAVIIVWLHLKNRKHESNPGFKQIFLYWLMLFFTYRVIGILPAHLYSLTGIHHAFNWLYIGFIYRIIVGVAGIVISFMVSVWIFNQICLINGMINNNFRILGISLLSFASVFFPVALCCMVSVLFFLPNLPKEEILGLLFIAIPALYSVIRLINSKPRTPSTKYQVQEIFQQWQIFIAVFILIVILRVLMGIGISVN